MLAVGLVAAAGVQGPAQHKSFCGCVLLRNCCFSCFLLWHLLSTTRPLLMMACSY
jgi:hypothetical protein